MKEEIEQRVKENLDRVESLVSIYKSFGRGKQGRSSVTKTDILRAAVVLLHASLEDLLRSLAGWQLPVVASSDSLDKVPFASSGGSRAKKVFLGYLVQHKGKYVDELIEESVAQDLERSNYNDTTEVSKLLKSINIDDTQVAKHYQGLSHLMERRHQIVHRADRIESKGSGNHKAKSIRVKEISDWIETVRNFSAEVLKLV